MPKRVTHLFFVCVQWHFRQCGHWCHNEDVPQTSLEFMTHLGGPAASHDTICLSCVPLHFPLLAITAEASNKPVTVLAKLWWPSRGVKRSNSSGETFKILAWRKKSLLWFEWMTGELYERGVGAEIEGNGKMNDKNRESRMEVMTEVRLRECCCGGRNMGRGLKA